ncbi:SANT/Myb domain-containing protein [Hirschfeldia incana]|nr:SANT/Myb domain-containing protein [Hirschfeldia incana]
MYESDVDDDDDIGEDLEELRRACIVSDSNSGGGMHSDYEEEDDFEMLRSIKTQLASSTDHPMGLSSSSLLSDSESDEDDFEMLRSLKSQLALPMEDDEDDETLLAICKRFSSYENSGVKGSLMNDTSPEQVHASCNEPSSELLSRSNTCESFSEDLEGESTSTEPPLSLAASSSSIFPESAQAFVDAIRKNRSYQKFLRRKLGEIEATIEKNQKLQKDVKIIDGFAVSCKRRMKQQSFSQGKDPRFELISTRKAKTHDGSEGNGEKTLGPLENPCVASYRMALEEYPVSVCRTNWSAKENEDLAKGLKQQLQEALILEATERSSDLEGCSDDIDTILESVSNLEITPEMIRQFLPKVNWDQLDIKNRSAAECEARWMSSEDPLINHGPWTAAEDDYIRLITQNKSVTDWLDVAVSLGTNRTPFQCLARYQRSLNPDILRREWTPEEDDQLRAAVGLYGEKDWQSVANEMEGRTGTQCSNRWNKSLVPSRKRVGKSNAKEAKWSSEEDKRLRVALTFFGAKNYNKIAQFVPGRTQSQCRARWKDSLDPRLNFGSWTEEEITKYNDAVEEHGVSNWPKVASHVYSRTSKQCSRRWETLNPHLKLLKKEAMRLRREATIGNFVDRESERPHLVASDFLALAERSFEPEPVLKKKLKAREKKADAECESEAIYADAERQPKRRKGLQICSGVVCRPANGTEDNGKEKKQRRKRKAVAGTSSENNITVTTDCSQVKVGIEKLKPRRKVSAVVPIENQNSPN